MPHRSIGLSGEQLRAARALARIEQADLAKWTRLSIETIKRLERIRGQVNANVRTLNAIGEAFEALGIRFESDGGQEGVWRAAADDMAGYSDRAAPAARDVRQRLVFHGPISAAGLDQLWRRGAPPGLAGFAVALDGVVLQAVEGDRDMVQRYYGELASDPSNGPFSVMASEPIVSCLFADWGACLGRRDPGAAALADEPAIAGGFRPARLSPAEALALLVRARERQRGSGARAAA